MDLQDNPLKELESMILSASSRFSELGSVYEIHPDEVQAIKDQNEALPEEIHELFNKEAINNDISAKNEESILYKRICKDATLAIQNKMENLSEEAQEALTTNLLDSISFMEIELKSRKMVCPMQLDSLKVVKEFILNRYITKDHIDVNDKFDDRLKLTIKPIRIKAYFKDLSDLGVITTEDLKLFLHSNFYGFEPRMEISEKIEVIKTKQSHLRYFIYRFKQDEFQTHINQKEWAKILHNSFTCFKNSKQTTTYKKMSEEPKLYAFSNKLV